MASVTLPTDPTGFSDIGSIITKALPYVLVIAGLGLLIMLIAGGITLMTAAGDPKKSAQGYGYITGGLIGFAIIFVSYFVVQIVSTVLGVTIF
jgi:hypothetical protein